MAVNYYVFSIKLKILYKIDILSNTMSVQRIKDKQRKAIDRLNDLIDVKRANVDDCAKRDPSKTYVAFMEYRLLHRIQILMYEQMLEEKVS